MADWGKFLIRTFGILHLAYGALGGLLQMNTTLKVLRSNPHSETFSYVYYANVCIGLLMLGALVLAGLWLIRLTRRGVTLSNFALVIEVLYWLAYDFISMGLIFHGDGAATVGKSMGAVAGIGQIALSLQLLTGYPLIALVGLNLARRHLERIGFWRKPSEVAG